MHEEKRSGNLKYMRKEPTLFSVGSLYKYSNNTTFIDTIVQV